MGKGALQTALRIDELVREEGLKLTEISGRGDCDSITHFGKRGEEAGFRREDGALALDC